MINLIFVQISLFALGLFFLFACIGEKIFSGKVLYAATAVSLFIMLLACVVFTSTL